MYDQNQEVVLVMYFGEVSEPNFKPNFVLDI